MVTESEINVWMLAALINDIVKIRECNTQIEPISEKDTSRQESQIRKF